MKQKKRSLTIQVVAFFVLLLMLPISAIGFYLFDTIEQDLARISREQISNTSSSVNHLMNKAGHDLLASVEMNSQWSDYRKAVEDRNVSWVDENINIAKGSSSNIDFIITTDTEGNILSKTDEIDGFTDKVRPDVIHHMQQKSKFYGIVPVSGELAVLAGSPISDEKGTAAPTGWLLYGQSVDDEMLKEMKSTLQSDISILTANHSFLTTDPTVTSNQLAPYILEAASAPAYQQMIFTNHAGLDSVEIYTPIADLSGQVVAIKMVSQALPATTHVKQEMIRAAIISGSIILLALFLVMMLIRKRIIRPVIQLADIITNVANGEFRMEVDVRMLNRGDELGMLFGSLAVMLRNMRELMQRIHVTATDHALQVAASAAELAAATEQTSSSNQQILLAIQAIAKGSKKVIAEAAHSQALIVEMNEGIKSITTLSANVSDSSYLTSEQAVEGGTIVNSAVSQMETVHQSFRNLDELVQRVGESSKKIDTIIRFITEIAAQTKLLALNAAIEAARAGEHGRGFAVVADEIRKLSEQTQASSNEIKQLVEVMRQHSVSSAVAVSGVDQDIRQALTSFQAAGEIFQQIVRSVQSVHDQTRDVYGTSRSILGSSEKVAQAVHDTSIYAKESEDQSQNVALSAQEQLDALKEVSSSSERLELTANQLQEVLRNVKI